MADGGFNDPTNGSMKLAELVRGGTDPRGRKVLDILWSVSEFKIFKTAAGVSPFFSDDPKLGREQKEAYLALGADIAAFNHLIHKVEPKKIPSTNVSLSIGGINEDNRILYERELARCIAQALLGNGEAARSGLAALKTRLEASISNRARVVHLLISLVIVAFVWLLALGLVSSGYTPRFEFETAHIALAALMGSIGALFSTAVGLRGMIIDPTVNLSMHWVHGFQRMLVGMMGAAIIYFGFMSGIVSDLFHPTISGPMTADTVEIHWLAFVSILAGFSERLVPNLLDGRANEATSGS